MPPSLYSSIKAGDFIEGNLNPGRHSFGRGLLIDTDVPQRFARYDFSVPQDGEYELWARYTSEFPRPLDIYVDGTLAKKGCLASATGGWTRGFLKWNREHALFLSKGSHILEIRSDKSIPHIEQFTFLLKGRTPHFVGQDRSFYAAAFLRKTFKEKVAKIRQKMSPSFLKESYLRFLGIYDTEYGYYGPEFVQIDLTDHCNNTCLACWCNSPLLKENRLKVKHQLSLETVKTLLDDLRRMGVSSIGYSGSGEPFMHPDIMEILEYTKRKGFFCLVNTNFTLLDKDKLRRLMDIGLDSLTVSVWAATPETYAKTHPHRSQEDFNRIKENLTYLNTRKKKTPRVHLYNVIFNKNYFEIDEMVDFARQTKSEMIGFALVDTMPGLTDILLPDEAQLAQIQAASWKIKAKLDERSHHRDNDIYFCRFDDFLRRVSVPKDAKEAKYDRGIIDSVPCYNGWLFARVIPNGEVHPCLKAHRIPSGSLLEKRFPEIWNSPEQAVFRKKTCVYRKTDPFFRRIGNDTETQEAGCYKGCDDIGRNLWMHERMHLLTPFEKMLLGATARFLKETRKRGQKRKIKRRGVLRWGLAGFLYFLAFGYTLYVCLRRYPKNELLMRSFK